MAKHKESSPAPPPLEQLQIDPGTPPEQIIARLWALRTAGSAHDRQIVALAGQLASLDAVALLKEIERGAAGELRREVRRALFRLHQQGIALPAPQTGPHPPPPLEAGPDQTRAAAPSQPGNLEATFSLIDADGNRLVWLWKARSQGGVSRLWAVTSQTEGLVLVRLDHVSRKELREERRELETRGGTRLPDIDWRLADFILCEAYRQTPEERRGRVGGFLAMRAELLPGPPASALEHPIYAEFAATLAQEPSAELLKEPEIASWDLAPLLKPYLAEIQELQNSPIVLSRFQQEERNSAVVARALGELFGGEGGLRARRRLEDTAYYLACTGRRPAAAWAASAAARLRDGQDLARSPFFRELLMAHMGLALSEQRAQEREEPRLIMSPAEAMRAQAQARTHRAPPR